jgi:hypothetical protein
LRRTTFSDEYETSLFIGKIGGIHDVWSPFFTFYNLILAQPQDSITFEYVKERFIAVDTSSSASSITAWDATVLPSARPNYTLRSVTLRDLNLRKTCWEVP